MTSQESYQKKLFVISALYNWAAAALFLGLYLFSHDLLSFFIKVPEQPVWYFLTIMAIALFGWGYYLVSKDVRRNRDIIKMAFVGKPVLFVLFFMAWQKGDLSFIIFALGFGDLVFATLYAQVLHNLKKRAKGPGVRIEGNGTV